MRRVVEDGLRAREAAQAAGVSVRIAYEWLRRYQEEGSASGIRGRVDDRLAAARPRRERPQCPGAGVSELAGQAARFQRIIEFRTTQGFAANLTVKVSGHSGASLAF